MTPSNDDLPELILGSRTQTPEAVNQVLEDMGYEGIQTNTLDDAMADESQEAGGNAGEGEGGEVDDASSETSQEAGGDAGEGAKSEAAPKKKTNGSAKLKERNADLTRRLEELEKRLAEQPAGGKTVEPPAIEATPEPQLDDVDENGEPKYEDHDAFVRATVRWTLREERRQENELRKTARETEAQNSVKAKADAEVTAAADRWNAQVEIGRSNHDDYDAVLESSNGMSAAVPLVEAMKDSDLHGELLYHLATHPELLAEMNEVLTPDGTTFDFRRKMRRAYEIVKDLEATVSAGMSGAPSKSAASGSGDTQRTDAARESRVPAAIPATPPKSKPEPVRPVGSRSGSTRKTLSQMSRDEIHTMQVQDPDGFRRLVEGSSGY